MSTKAIAQAEARRLRKKYPGKTVNVRELSRGSYGIRFSPKGKRDTWAPGARVCPTSGRVIKPAKKRR
jgi:hypothetical protein